MQPALDLTRTAWSQRHGEITCYGTWWRREAGGSRPCLALVRTNARSEEMIPCVVILDDAWVFDEAIGDPRKAARVSMQFAKVLGLTNDAPNVFRIAGLIHDHLGDLCSMAPEPAPALVSLGEARVTERESGRVIHHELVEGA